MNLRRIVDTIVVNYNILHRGNCHQRQQTTWPDTRLEVVDTYISNRASDIVTTSDSKLLLLLREFISRVH